MALMLSQLIDQAKKILEEHGDMPVGMHLLEGIGVEAGSTYFYEKTYDIAETEREFRVYEGKKLEGKEN